MNRRMRSTSTILLVLAAIGGFPAAAASSQFFIEGELGGQTVTGDAKDLFKPSGVALGGGFGYEVTPMFALVGHGDLGIHDGSSDLEGFIDSGVTLTLSIGGRVLPFGEKADLPFQPYLGVGVGRSVVAWSYSSFAGTVIGEDSDGVGAWTGIFEAGGDFRASRIISLGAGAQFHLNSWDDETTHHLDTSSFDSQSIRFIGHMTLHL